MREQYFKKLEDNLLVLFNEEEAKAIIKDYEELFDDYLAEGLSEEQVINKLGTPKDIVKAIAEENRKVIPTLKKANVVLPRRGGEKIIAASPLLATIIFLVLGFTVDAWHPGWLVFLLIPLSGIIFTPYRKGKIVSASPFISVIIFILIGTYVPHGYSYAWIIFFMIPLAGIFTRK